MNVRVGHLYPDYLNIYADRGNIAVLARRAEWRGHRLEVEAIGIGEQLRPGDHDLLYVGGGQDREQLLVAGDMAAKAPELRKAVAGGAAVLHTIAGERRMIGDVLLECELEPGEKRTLAGFENHAGRTRLDPGATPLGRVVAGFGNDGESGFEGCRAGRVLGTYLHGPLLPRNPWLADWLLAQALAHRTGSAEAPWLEPLDEELETDAHTVSAQRARDRGGRF